MQTSRAIRIAYESVMAALAIATIVLAVRPITAATERAIFYIWMVFVADYLIRLAIAPLKWRFIRDNWVDLIAIVPIGWLRAARLLRMLRVLRAVRGMAVLWRVSATVRGVCRTNQLGYVMCFTSAMILAGGIIIYEVEPEIGTLPDGLWWSLVTATTVGYGDIAPKTAEGRALAAVLMIVGIGTIGMITGSIATYFIGANGSKNPHIRHVQGQLDSWEEMTSEERGAIVRVLEALNASAGSPTESGASAAGVQTRDESGRTSS